jgi:hypothetical protein
MNDEMLKMNLQMFAEDKVEDKTEDKVEDKTDAKVDGKPEDKKTDAKTFTQDEVSRMMSKEKKQGRNSILNDLGIDEKNADKAFGQFKAFLQAQKTDEEKVVDEQNLANQKVVEAEQRAIKAEIKAESMVLGAKADMVDDVIVLVAAKMTDDADIKTIVSEIKKKYPSFFSDSKIIEDPNEKKKKVGQKGTGNSIKNLKDDKKEESDSMGSRLAAQRKGQTKKTKYFK